jgi:DNA-directed RNA polymerase specialized sigma54-like protein
MIIRHLEADQHSWTKQELEDYERVSIMEGRIRLAEKRITRRIVKAMKEEGYSIEAIAKVTELTTQEVEKL